MIVDQSVGGIGVGEKYPLTAVGLNLVGSKEIKMQTRTPGKTDFDNDPVKCIRVRSWPLDTSQQIHSKKVKKVGHAETTACWNHE